MPRLESATLAEIFAMGAYSRRLTLDVYLADGSVLRLSQGAVTRVIGGAAVVYSDDIRNIGEMSSTVDKSIDRITVSCQNADSFLGRIFSSGGRLFDYAFANYGKIYQSAINPTLIEDIPRVFSGVVAGASVNTTMIEFDLIADYESLWRTVSARSLSPKCDAVYKDGINCTSQSAALDCPKTREACRRRLREYENMGWEFFEEPVTDTPGSGTNLEGGFTGENPYNRSEYYLYQS